MALKYRPEIDGLRAVAVVPVVFFHAGFAPFAGGFVGVDIFFVISGYLITSLLLQDITQNRFSIVNFYERRARRILPALFLVMAVSSVIAWAWMLPGQLESFGQSLAAVTVFASNLFFYRASNYFAPSSELMPLLHTWSLAVEEQFYILFPLVLALVARWRTRVAVLVFGAGLVLSLMLAEFLIPRAGQLAFYLPPTRAWELLAGVLCAYALRHGVVGAPNQWISLAGLCAICGGIALFNLQTPTPGLQIAAVVAGVVAVILFAGPGTIAYSLLASKVLVGIGLVSYSTYLWHQPLFAFARIRHLDHPSTLTYLVLSVLSVALGAISWRYVERPFRERRDGAFRISARTVFSGSILGAAVFLALGSALGTRWLAPPYFAKLADVEQDIQANLDAVSPYVADDICDIFPASDWRIWACDPFSDPLPLEGLTPVGVAVVGDSYAGDLAAALRMAGLSPLQGSAPGCNVDPDFMDKGCRDFFDHIKSAIAGQPLVTEIWIDASYLPVELTDAALDRIVAYWTIGDRMLFFKSASPIFRELQNKRLAARLRGRTPAHEPDLGEQSWTTDPRVLARLAESGVRHIDGGRLFCTMAPGCTPALEDGRYLMRDKNHLTVEGLRRFGAALVADLACGTSPALSAAARCPTQD